MRIGIAGMTGRMGRLLIEEARAAGHELVGGTVHTAPGPEDLPALSLPDLAASSDVVIDSLGVLIALALQYVTKSRKAKAASKSKVAK